MGEARAETTIGKPADEVWAVIGARWYSHAITGISARIITALEYSHSVGSHH